MAGTKVTGLVLGEEPGPWEDLGFCVDGSVAQVGATALLLHGGGAGGLTGWVLQGSGSGDVDGIPTTWVDGAVARPGTHPNGATSVDHVVVSTPDAERTFGALQAAGMRLRREWRREIGGREVRYGFFRHGECIVECLGPPTREGDGPATLWGITIVVADLDATARLLGDRLGPAKAAVQPGRRIATARPGGSSTPLAFMSAEADDEAG